MPLKMTQREAEKLLSPQTKKALKQAGSYENAVDFVEHMLRNVDGQVALRIKSGNLTDAELADEGDFYTYRHAAWLQAHFLYNMDTRMAS
jgi:hypothetical protein